jgi:hypothetical protein
VQKQAGSASASSSRRGRSRSRGSGPSSGGGSRSPGPGADVEAAARSGSDAERAAAVAFRRLPTGAARDALAASMDSHYRAALAAARGPATDPAIQALLPSLQVALWASALRNIPSLEPVLRPLIQATLDEAHRSLHEDTRATAGAGDDADSSWIAHAEQVDAVEPSQADGDAEHAESSSSDYEEGSEPVRKRPKPAQAAPPQRSPE